MSGRKYLPKFVSAKDAAKLLDVNYETVLRQVKLGNIPAIKVGKLIRIERSVLYKLIKN